MATAATDWIEWKPGDCPVAHDTLVQVQLREETRGEAEAQQPRPARFWNWKRGPRAALRNVIAYRVVQS